MEVTGDIDMSRSLQLVAKANIIITTVRKVHDFDISGVWLHDLRANLNVC